MKKYFLLLSLLFMIITAKTQNDTIGPYLIYTENDNFYLIIENDTLTLNRNGITIKFMINISESVKEIFAQDYNLRYVRKTIGDYYYYQINNTENYIEECNNIYVDECVSEFIFDFKVHYHSFEPNDPNFYYQWYLFKIQADKAFNITTGAESITVAVLDEGLFLDHNDIGDNNKIIENIYHNPGEDEWTNWQNPNSANTIDDDLNGKMNDWKGWNFANYDEELGQLPDYFVEDNNVIPEQDWAYHGNGVSGIIAAKTNNNLNITGIAGGNYDENIGGVKILPIKVSDWRFNEQAPVPFWEEQFNSSSIAAAVQYAVEKEADIINMSFGLDLVGSIYPPLFANIEAALEYAYTNNTVLVASAGNDGDEWELQYPAASEYVIAVGATDQYDEDCDWSNNGTGLDLVAPGIDILTLNKEDFEEMAGTSFSAPMVAATAALMRSIIPELPNTTIWDILITTAEEVGSHSYINGWNKYMGYGRLNTYYAVCEVLKLLPPKTINFTDVWYEPVFTLHDIIIESGGTLVVYSTVALGNDARIIVKPGATLIVDGGTLTNYKFCGHEDNLWKGVEVWGNDEQSQYPCNGTQYQGKIVLQNGATIENAEIGVLLCARDGVNYNTEYSGGIIQISDDQNENTRSAYFINNKYSINFKEYSNYSLGFNCSNLAPADNLSFIKDCKFEINQDYLENSWHKACIYMSDVNGIKIAGCEFANNYNELHGHGINAYNAGFKVYDLCNSQVLPCPEGEESECTFTNFGKGINLGNINSTNTLSVENAVFTNNSNGITLSNVHNAAVLFSDFYIGENPDEEGECEGEGQSASGYGIDMTGCTGFAIEENNFYKYSGAPSGDYTGVRIAETQATDEVYKNTFDGLSYGNYAVGKNWFGLETYHGLAYYCNENTGNWEDFTVEDVPNQDDGIQNPQGTVEMPAGNTFSANANYNIHNWDFNNWIGYFYYAPTLGNTNTVYYPEEVNRVTLHEIVGIQNGCPSHYGGGGSGGGSGKGLVLSPGEKLEAEQDYATSLTYCNNVKALYDNLKDGGNTEATLSDVETAWPNDMWELRSELLGKSPHLSMDVLKAAAGKTEVLPESIIFEIMAANPDELKKEELIKYLEDKENPLPAYMIDILKQVANGTTYKTVLQQQMAHYNQVKTKAAHDIIRSLLNDTITDYVELRNWLDNIGGKRADEQIISTYVQEGNYTNAMNLANMMPALYEYKDNEIAEHNYYIEILNLQDILANENRTIFDLDSTEVNNLVFIADNSNGTAGSQAKGILEFAYGYHYCNCINADTSGYKSSGSFNYNAFNKAFGPEIEVKPNPANEWTSFNFTLPDSESEGIIKISDVSGKVIESFVVNGLQGQKIWDTRKIKQGVYLYTFTVNGISKSGKIIISK